MSNDKKKLIIQNVYKTFVSKTNTVAALKDVSFSVADGEFVCLVGPSGCGKSTLLNLIAGLDSPDKGEILEDNIPITGPGNDRIVMFQEAALFPWLNVIDNVLFGINLKPEIAKKERKNIATHYLKMVGLEKFLYSNIHELSGGMKQRVALARSLAPNPQVLLMDEPFAALDALTREQLYEDIQNIWIETKKTIVFVTHNVAEAACLGDRILLFDANPGRLSQEFKIDLKRPRDVRSVAVAECAASVTAVLKSHLKRSS